MSHIYRPGNFKNCPSIRTYEPYYSSILTISKYYLTTYRYTTCQQDTIHSPHKTVAILIMQMF